MSFCGLVGVVSHVSSVPPRRMRMVPRLFVMPSLVMLCRFVMVMRGMRTVFRCLLVVLGCFFRHAFTPFGRTPREETQHDYQRP